MDECAFNNVNCKSSTSQCVDQINGYSCNCSKGWKGIDCSSSKFILHPWRQQCFRFFIAVKKIVGGQKVKKSKYLKIYRNSALSVSVIYITKSGFDSGVPPWGPL